MNRFYIKDEANKINYGIATKDVTELRENNLVFGINGGNSLLNLYYLRTLINELPIQITKNNYIGILRAFANNEEILKKEDLSVQVNTFMPLNMTIANEKCMGNVFFDVFEKMDAVFSDDGTEIMCIVNGKIIMRPDLSKQSLVEVGILSNESVNFIKLCKAEPKIMVENHDNNKILVRKSEVFCHKKPVIMFRYSLKASSPITMVKSLSGYEIYCKIQIKKLKIIFPISEYAISVEPKVNKGKIKKTKYEVVWQLDRLEPGRYAIEMLIKTIPGTKSTRSNTISILFENDELISGVKINRISNINTYVKYKVTNGDFEVRKMEE